MNDWRTTYERLPVVTHCESTSSCQLACPFCPRAITTAERGDHIRFMQPDALRAWVQRGDFEATPYTELQMSGEPLLHPQLDELIHILRREGGVLCGFSTNGLLLERRIEAIRDLSLLIVSVDSLEPAEYAVLRPRIDGKPGDLAELLRNLDFLFASPLCPPHVDIQMVGMLDDRMPDGSPGPRVQSKMAALRERFPDPRVTMRISWDTRSAMMGRGARPAVAEMCTDPWDIVVVHSDGTVASCNTSWGRADQNTYGNLYQNTLLDIWNGPKVKAMREAQRCGTAGGDCTLCHSKNARRIHRSLIPLLTRDIARGHVQIG